MKQIASLIIYTTACTGTVFAVFFESAPQSSNQSASTPSEHSSSRLTITPGQGWTSDNKYGGSTSGQAGYGWTHTRLNGERSASGQAGQGWTSGNKYGGSASGQAGYGWTHTRLNGEGSASGQFLDINQGGWLAINISFLLIQIGGGLSVKIGSMITMNTDGLLPVK